MAGLTRRNNIWHLRMRVPKRYAVVESRSEITRSLRTTSEQEARVRLPAAEAMVIAELDARLTMTAAKDDSSLFSAAVSLAATRGISYLPAADLAERPVEEILDRIEALKPSDDPTVTQAILGGVEVPSIKVSHLVDEVERISRYSNRFKNEEQMRLWRNPRKRAVANLIEAVGEDCEIVEIDRARARQHRTLWQERLVNSNLKPKTANKDFTNMGSMLALFYDDIGHDNPPRPYQGLNIKDRNAVEVRKVEVPLSLITDRWFAPGSLDGLNSEARDILLMSIETGCRQSEIYNLPADAIILDVPIPHIRIKHEEGDEGREVKNTSSFREIPLVGVALAAACRHPDGFPRYRGNSNYSNKINDYLRDNNLLPDKGTTAGGIRHTWESRLIAADRENDKRAAMMGHSIKAARGREVYGNTMSLEQKLKIAEELMLPVPEHLA